ncbi:PEGA domain-containing protein [Sandaracinus amylolyticus]|uniref:S-layer-like array protein n=1 Tax=Sandaracinus amylolyticus TaxID=927083 RepID=A0A0F6W491_9BACT|nr:PEGA domain-containing protein [Sandaracinus amylolyticus]AKF06896.1 S-layer-like array protein [Sandaracinus amylolyticus]
MLALRAALVAFLGVLVWSAPVDAQRRRTPRAPAQGTLALQATQAGAEVFVDEQPVGTTPLDPITLAPGSHTVRVRMAGYTEFTDVVHVAAGQRTEVSVELFPLSQVLAVTTEPPGAHVYVDGDFMGDTPVEFDLLEGAHSLRVAHRGYADVVRQIEARAGTREELQLTLEALPPEMLSDTPDTTEWYEEPVTWIAIGGGAVAIAVAITVIAVVTTSEQGSELQSFCELPGGCFRVETPW